MNSKIDSKTFFKLVNNQRKASNTQLQTLIVGSREYETTDKVREGWAEHFERHATLLHRPQFDQQYKRLMCLDVDVIELLCTEETSPITPVTEAEVTSALKRLNNNKAMDIMGITSEHFKLAGQDVHEYLTCFFLASSLLHDQFRPSKRVSWPRKLQGHHGYPTYSQSPRAHNQRSPQPRAQLFKANDVVS